MAICELVQSVSISQFSYLVIPSAFGCTVIIVIMYIYILGKARKILSLKPFSSTSKTYPGISTTNASHSIHSASASDSYTLETVEN